MLLDDSSIGVDSKKHSTSPRIDQPATVTQLETQLEPPNEGKSWKSRAFPGWEAIFESWAITDSNSTRTNVRHICMWIILIFRISVIWLVSIYGSLGTQIGSLFGGGVLGVLNAGFTVWCLAIIDHATREGNRRLWCVRVVRASRNCCKTP